MSSVFDDLVQDEVIPTNPALGVKLPDNAKPRDDRERARLTDAEFERFVGYYFEHEPKDVELMVMAVVSRCLGGARSSDLLALDWCAVGWESQTIRVERQKTRGKGIHVQHFELPEQLADILRAWHSTAAEPTVGPIFPQRKGSKAGERRQGKFSYAKALRKALRLAFGIDAWQAVPFVRANGRADSRKKVVQVRELTPRERELFEDGQHSRPVDFHSFRRAYVDGAARSGLNAQTAMQLTGHTNYSTHRRYQSQADVLRTPETMLPKLLPLWDGETDPPKEKSPESSGLSGLRGLPAAERRSRAERDNEKRNPAKCEEAGSVSFRPQAWLRGGDLNQRPSGH